MPTNPGQDDDTAEAVEPNRGGRPPKLQPDEKTLNFLKGLGVIMCTTKEPAAALSVTEPTFRKFLKDHEEAREAFAIGKGQAAVSLRRKQWKLADKSAAMAIFLGKNYLEQSDRQEHTGPNGGPIEYANMSREARQARIAELQARRAERNGGD